MHFNGLRLGGALEEFMITSQFLGLKMQNQFFEEIKRFESSFYRIEVQVIINLSSKLKKTPTTLIMTYFL